MLCYIVEALLLEDGLFLGPVRAHSRANETQGFSHNMTRVVCLPTKDTLPRRRLIDCHDYFTLLSGTVGGACRCAARAQFANRVAKRVKFINIIQKAKTFLQILSNGPASKSKGLEYPNCNTTPTLTN